MAEARLNQVEMLRTFNCGIGMVVVVSPGDADRVRKRLGDDATIIGTIAQRGRGTAARYKGKLP